MIAVLEGVCQALPEAAKLMCDGLISMESSKIIKFLMDHTKDPRQVCTVMHMCSKPTAPHNGIVGKCFCQAN